MRRIKSTLVLVLFNIPTLASAADRIIPPNIPPRTVMATARVAMDPAIERSGARAIATLRALRPSVAEESGVAVDGVVQRLDRPIRIEVPSAPGFAPTLLGKITIHGAQATRIRFNNVPEGTALWIAGSDDEDFVRFEPSMTSQWGPTVRGSIVYVAADGEAGEMEIAELAHLAPIAQAQTSCLSDVACRTDADYVGIEDASRAIGYVRFIRDGKSYVCSGGLLNDATSSGTPYFLTANHCISTQEEAASVEVVWDLKSEACGSNRMAPNTRSYGAQLLVASATTDVALLKLSAVPAGRVFLGIDTRALAEGTVVHRVSHAGGLSQTYSSAVIEQGGMTCYTAPRGKFVYSKLRVGATAGGSSGAPLLLTGLYVAGQLLGTCGPDPSSSCATFNSSVDGALRESWPLLAPYLDPSAPTTPSKRRSVR